MIRLRVEQHAVEQANQRVRLLATAAEQAVVLILIPGRDSGMRVHQRRVLPRVKVHARGLDSLPPTTLGL